MPLPNEAIAIRGGCNCGAIRYRIAVPEFSKRPLHFSFPPEAASDPSTPRMPFVCTDHCNDCRSATSALLPCWILTPADMMTISCLPMADGTYESDEMTAPFGMPKLALAPRDAAEDENRPPYEPAREVLRGAKGTRGTWLRQYASRDMPDHMIKRSVRSFCGRCGSHLSYVIDPTPLNMLDTVDVVLGTVDRADLEREWMQPERQLWWELGIPWVQEMVNHLPGDKHPIYKLDEAVKEAI
ncbi:hypothetical protein GQ53DRAFT_748508 [Thozetella sp. PMI_491]|nr:hypothetical protein GQ53DRAFT_748508 [Thozetella sp. PMI_491]